MGEGHGEKLTRKMEAAVAALLTCPTVTVAAEQVGVSEKTLRTWLKLPTFRAAFRSARRELLEGAVGRIQAAAGQAVDTLLAVAVGGAKDGDRVRAAVAILDHAFRAAELADVPHGDAGADGTGDAPAIDGTAGVVKLLAARLAQLESSELPTAEKSRLTATLADALLRAFGVDVLDKRLEALQTVLSQRERQE